MKLAATALALAVAACGGHVEQRETELRGRWIIHVGTNDGAMQLARFDVGLCGIFELSSHAGYVLDARRSADRVSFYLNGLPITADYDHKRLTLDGWAGDEARPLEFHAQRPAGGGGGRWPAPP